MRPTKLQNYMAIAEVVAQRSHDAETKVGALLVNNRTGAVLATAYNGFVRGCADSMLPTTRPEKYPYIIHAELNLITNCARHGVSMADCFMVCTMSPCKLCVRMVLNSGITKAVVKELYRDWPDVTDMLDIKVSHYKNEDGFYEIAYEPR